MALALRKHILTQSPKRITPPEIGVRERLYHSRVGILMYELTDELNKYRICGTYSKRGERRV